MTDLTKPVETRDGRAVRLLCTDVPFGQPVLGVIEHTHSITKWSAEGAFVSAAYGNKPCAFDLVNVKPVKESVK